MVDMKDVELADVMMRDPADGVVQRVLRRERVVVPDAYNWVTGDVGALGVRVLTPTAREPQPRGAEAGLDNAKRIGTREPGIRGKVRHGWE